MELVEKLGSIAWCCSNLSYLVPALQRRSKHRLQHGVYFTSIAIARQLCAPRSLPGCHNVACKHASIPVNLKRHGGMVPIELKMHVLDGNLGHFAVQQRSSVHAVQKGIHQRGVLLTEACHRRLDQC